MDREAFTGEALLAVAVAVSRYRPELGATFLHFAYTQVHFALIGEARRQDPVGKWRRSRLRAGQGEERPSERPPCSLDRVRDEEEGAGGDWELDPAPGPEAWTVAAAEGARVREALRSLDGREQRILHLRYWEEETQTAVAARIGVSPARVNQIERRALGKLRRMLEGAGEERAGRVREERRAHDP
jgi:RNA polymerase sigma factor (sigma-70 family)